jgi:hypothetical protein
MSRITGFDAANLIEAYNAVYAPQEEVELTEEQIQEDFENWVNSLVEEGHDLSEYTWEEMYEEYLNEVIRPTTGQQTAPRPTTSPRPTPAATGYNPAGGGMGGARGSRGPVVSQRPAPSRFGTTTPKGSSVTSTGVSGLSAADRAAYSAGGGNTAAQRGMGQTTSQVIAQGKANLNRMDQGRPAPARPVASAPASTRPVATAPARPAPSAPAAPRPTPAATAPSAPAAPRPSLAQQRSELEQIRKKSQQRQIAQGGTPATPLVQSFDPFDIVMGYLIDEGYAETEEAATVIMTNMSEEWRQSIVEYSDLSGFKPSAFPNIKQYPAVLNGNKGMVSGQPGTSGRGFRKDPKDYNAAVSTIERNTGRKLK